MKKLAFVVSSFFLIVVDTYAQNRPQMKNGNGANSKGTVTGTVIDKKSGDAVEFANVIVCKNSDSAMITGGLTNSKGKFTIDNVPYGKYFVKVNFIGYKTNLVPSFLLDDNHIFVNLHSISLEAVATDLDVVTINGEKDQVEYNLDKKVVNVDKNLLTAGGTALDVMQTIPSVSVDIEGNVSLRGSTNATIFVDGRP